MGNECSVIFNSSDEGFSNTLVLAVNDSSLSAARRPAPSATPATPVASTNGENSHRRRVITKPPVPKQTPVEKKPPVPRAPRNPRPINAPTPDLKNVRSKIGSTDNMKYQPGGGKVGPDCTVTVRQHGFEHVFPVLVFLEDDRDINASYRNTDSHTHVDYCSVTLEHHGGHQWSGKLLG